MAPALDPRSLLDVDVRLHVELGRTQMPLAQAVGLPDGAVVDLDRAPDEPVDVFVNGKRFGWGRLMVVDGEWALRLERLVAEPASPAPEEPALAPRAEAAAEVLAETAAAADPAAEPEESLAAAAAAPQPSPVVAGTAEERMPTAEEYKAMPPYKRREAKEKWGAALEAVLQQPSTPTEAADAPAD